MSVTHLAEFGSVDWIGCKCLQLIDSNADAPPEHQSGDGSPLQPAPITQPPRSQSVVCFTFTTNDEKEAAELHPTFVPVGATPRCRGLCASITVGNCDEETFWSHQAV